MADSQFIVENGIKVSDVATVNTELNSTAVTGTLSVTNNVTASANVSVGKDLTVTANTTMSKNLTVSGSLTLGNTTSAFLLTGASANIAVDAATFMNVVTFKANVNFDTPVTFTSVITSNGDLRPYNNTYSLGNTTNRWSEIYVNNATVTTQITVGTATVNSTVYSGTANNATNLGGLAAASYANLVYVNNQVGNAYSNAILFASDASNINTGTVAIARLPAGNSTAAGILQIIDSVTNTSVTIAAAANSVKLAYDTAVAAGNAALAYSNAATYADNRAANAYSNAILFASNASNVNTGTVAIARLPVGNTTAAGILQLSTSTSSTDATVAATASAVKTAFDNGTTAYSNAVSNTTAQVAAYTGTSNVVTVGTVTTGTWNATIIAVNRGGTGVNTHSQGLIWANGTSNFAAASAAQVVGVIGTTNVANATYATSAGSATSATSATTASALTTTAGYQVGSLGVGTANSGTNNGEIRATGDITAFYSSDRRLKENVINIADALSKVNSINGVEFDWSENYIKDRGGEDSYFMRKHDVGVIAQELQTVLPEAVAERENGMLAVKYERIVPLLIEAVKELSNKVKELEQKLQQ